MIAGVVLLLLYVPVAAVLSFWRDVFAVVLGPDSGFTWLLAVVFLSFTLRAVLLPVDVLRYRIDRGRPVLPTFLTVLRSTYLTASFLGMFLVVAIANGRASNDGDGPSLVRQAPSWLLDEDDFRSLLSSRIFGAPLTVGLRSSGESLDAFANFGGVPSRFSVVVVAVVLVLVTVGCSLIHERLKANIGAGDADFNRRTWYFIPFALAIFLSILDIALLAYWCVSYVWKSALLLFVMRSVEMHILELDAA